MALVALISLLLPAVVFSQPGVTIGPAPDDMAKYPGIEPWMLSGEINFHLEGWWIGGYSQKMMVKWADHDVFVKDLTQMQKMYLWEKMTPAQRAQMSEVYGSTSMGGMLGYLKNRPADWGPELNERIVEYQRGVSGWAEVRKNAQRKHTPPEVFQFLDDKAKFITQNKDKLKPEDITKINEGAEAVEKLGQMIAVLELKKIEIAVKGLSGGLIGIITDYCTGFATHGAHYVSDAIATVVSKIIDLGKNAANKSLSPGEQIQLINQQLDLARGTLKQEIADQRAMWAALLGEDPADEPPAGPVELSILFLVDCSGSMGGSKIEAAKQAVVNSVNQTNDGKTEWALLGFGGGCTCWQVVPFTTDAGAVQSAASGLDAGGGTPLTYAIYKATAYLVKNGHGKTGRLIVLCDGENNCGERAEGGRSEAAAGLRSIISTHNLAAPVQQP